MAELAPFLFFRPWRRPFGNPMGAETELRRELGPQHILYGRSFRAVGVTGESDDWLFELDDGTFAQVHLTWTRKPPETNANCPRTRIFGTLDEWVIAVMLPDHVDRFGL